MRFLAPACAVLFALSLAATSAGAGTGTLTITLAGAGQGQVIVRPTDNPESATCASGTCTFKWIAPAPEAPPPPKSRHKTNAKPADRRPSAMVLRLKGQPAGGSR